MNKIINRIYTEFFMRSYLNEYEELLINALNKGYKFISVEDYSNLIKNNALDKQKIIVLRHDVDLNISITKKMFDIEQKHKINSTYYFRHFTMNDNLINYMISKNMVEVSYHYEEIAQFCKDNKIKSKEKILERISEIESIFLNNYEKISKKYNLKLKTVASHGDFVNRVLDISNNYILKSSHVRNQTQIQNESYDEELFSNCDIYIADRPYKLDFHPIPLSEAIDNNQVIYLLIHPGNWTGSIRFGLKNIYARIRDLIKLWV